MRTEIMILLPDGKGGQAMHFVEAERPNAWFAVHEVYEADAADPVHNRPRHLEEQWTVTHVPTGTRATLYWRLTQAQARRIAQELPLTGVDWEQADWNAWKADLRARTLTHNLVVGVLQAGAQPAPSLFDSEEA